MIIFTVLLMSMSSVYSAARHNNPYAVDVLRAHREFGIRSFDRDMQAAQPVLAAQAVRVEQLATALGDISTVATPQDRKNVLRGLSLNEYYALCLEQHRTGNLPILAQGWEREFLLKLQEVQHARKSHQSWADGEQYAQMCMSVIMSVPEERQEALVGYDARGRTLFHYLSDYLSWHTGAIEIFARGLDITKPLRSLNAEDCCNVSQEAIYRIGVTIRKTLLSRDKTLWQKKDNVTRYIKNLKSILLCACNQDPEHFMYVHPDSTKGNVFDRLAAFDNANGQRWNMREYAEQIYQEARAARSGSTEVAGPAVAAAAQ